MLLIPKLLLFIFYSLNEFFIVDSLFTEVSNFWLELVFDKVFFYKAYFFYSQFLNVFIY